MEFQNNDNFSKIYHDKFSKIKLFQNLEYFE